MPLALALGGALFYGFADFSGGYAAKRLPPWGVAALSQTIGLAVLALGLILFPADSVTAADIAWGAGAGVGGVVGIGLLYRALAEGTMAVVSPVTAATTAALPVIVDVATGGELTFIAGVGVMLALLAIMAIARRWKLPLRLSLGMVSANSSIRARTAAKAALARLGSAPTRYS